MKTMLPAYTHVVDWMVISWQGNAALSWNSNINIPADESMLFYHTDCQFGPVYTSQSASVRSVVALHSEI
jgi:hypothetical protein